MDRQLEGSEGGGDVSFENVKVGEDCVFVNVSTTGKGVTGKDITVQDHTVFYGGQMSDQSLQGLPLPTRSQGIQRAAFVDRHGTGRPLERGDPTGLGARRPAW